MSRKHLTFFEKMVLKVLKGDLIDHFTLQSLSQIAKVVSVGEDPKKD